MGSPSCRLLCSILLPTFVVQTSGYTKYAAPIQLAQSNSNGVYEFDLVVQKKLSMAYYDDEKHEATPVDYDPNTVTWIARNVKQAHPCFATKAMDLSTTKDSTDMQDVVSLDGQHRRIITINGKSPADPIVVPLGAEVLLKATNNIYLDSITIHVHGIDKKDLWFMDGVPFLQQCPITSMTYFEYRFIADRKGTHWLHGHMHTDRSDGLVGAFIVVDQNYTTSSTGRDYAVVLQDWGVQLAETSWNQFKEKTMKWMYGFDDNTQCWAPKRMSDGGGMGGSVPLSAILFNDKGWYLQDDVLKIPHQLPLERFLIKKEEAVRLRLINAGASQELMIHVQGHQMTVVAADGEDVVPKQVDRLILFPGERYDILVTALTNPMKKSYIIQAETISFYNWDWSSDSIAYGAAYLEYEDSNAPEDTSMPNYLPIGCTTTKKCTVLNCPFEYSPANFNYTCLSYDSLENAHPELIDREILKDSGFTSDYEEHFINMHYDSRVDGYRFQFPKGLPYNYKDNLGAITNPCTDVGCNNEDHKFSPNCSCFYHKEHKLGNIVQVTMYNMGTGGGAGTGYAHPFHVHGTHFYVMKVGWPSYNSTSGYEMEPNQDMACDNDTSLCNAIGWRNSSWLNGAVQGMNIKNPTSRDTVALPVGGYIVLRFRANNPGWWLAHCHIMLHMMEGMAYAFKVGDEGDFMPPPNGFPNSCGPFFMTSLPTRPTPQTQGSSALSLLYTTIFASFLSL